MTMYQANQRVAWDHTGTLAAILVNVNKTKGRSVTPEDFNPYRRPRKHILDCGNVSALKALAGTVDR